MLIYSLHQQGYYDTMDAGYVDPEGYVFVMAREDDVINVAGHRLSTSALEEACLQVSNYSYNRNLSEYKFYQQFIVVVVFSILIS